MDILHKFNNIRGRSHTTSANVPPRPTADEWYIPYTGRISPPSQVQTNEKKAKSHRAPHKSASHGNLLSVMCGGGLGDIATLKPHGKGNRRGQEVFVDPAAGGQKHYSRHQRGASTSALSPSSHLNKSRHAALSPSYTSVPTGLAEPNILFSPLNRQLRASAKGSREDTSRYAHGSYLDHQDMDHEKRQRAVSAPHRSKHQHHNPYSFKEEPRQWHPSSSSELFILPRPHLLAQPLQDRHGRRSSIGSLTTMTSSDDAEKVLENGKARMREREEWAGYVERRGRAISLGCHAEPPPDALPVGNAKARERERSRSRERGKNNSMSSLNLGIIQGRKRSTSLGNRWARHSRGSSVSDIHKNDQNRRLLEPNASEKPSEIPESFAFVKSASTIKRDVFPPTRLDASKSVSQYRPESPVIQGLYTRGHIKSNPNLLSSFASNNPSHNPYVAPHSGPSLHFKQPSIADRGLVVVIGRGASSRCATKMAKTNDLLPPLDLSKPLPDLPPEADLLVTPNDLPVTPSSDSIGVAISPDMGGLRGFEVSQAPVEQVDAPSFAIANADEELALSPLSPVVDTSRTAPELPVRYSQDSRYSIEEKRLSSGSTGSSTARAFLAKQHQRARLKQAFQSPLQSPSGYRRQEDSISSVKPLTVSTSTNISNVNTTATSAAFAAANNSSGVLPVPSLRSVNDYTDARKRKTAVSMGDMDKQEKRGPTEFAGANETPCSKAEIKGTEKELDPKLSDTPSTAADDEDFQGLFFRTPLDSQTTSSLPSHDTSSRLAVPYARWTNSPGEAKPSQTVVSQAEQELSQGKYRPVSEGSDDGTYLEIGMPEMLLNDQALAADNVISPGPTKLLAPITIGEPLDIQPRKPDAKKDDGSEEAANSYETFSAQNTPSTPPPVSISTESISAPPSPSLPESGTIPAQNPSILPSPVTFSVSHQRYLVNPAYPSYSLNFSSPQQNGRSPSWTRRKDSRGDIPLSPAIGGYRDSMAISFVDKFPSPPQRYQQEGEAEEKIYSPMRRTYGIDS
ncbi:hypothetical protein C366_01126 [Cryptococcus neoformans Tu401-1]|nr:hypothetical protein C366_01126 [Cryptococcus neoformans var. grubii Tu401-1]